jgi:hypothetical protein
MPEVSLGLGLERFTLVARGETFGVVDVLEDDSATLVLSALPDFPITLGAEVARQLVAAWQQRQVLEGQQYGVQEEQRQL